MFGISFSEIVVIFMVALIVFGPARLPGMAREAGRFLLGIRKASENARREFYNAIYEPARGPHEDKEAKKDAGAEHKDDPPAAGQK